MSRVKFTKEERRQLTGHRQKLADKDQQILRLLATQLGYGEWDHLNDEVRARVLEEHEEVIGRYEEDVEMGDQNKAPTSTEGLTPLQALLFERSLITDDIGVIEMGAAERYARTHGLTSDDLD